MRNKTKDPNRYPKGLDTKKVAAIIRHYDNQSDEDAAVEIETAPLAEATAWMQVPDELVPRVKKLIQSYRKSA